MGNMFRDELEDRAVQRYRNLICSLKVCQQDVQILHRHLIGETFISNHEFLEGVYKELAEMVDELAELGITLNVKEPSISSCIQYKTPITVESRDIVETMNELCKCCELLYEEMDDLKNESSVPTDVVSKIDEYQLKLRSFAVYKANQVLRGAKIF